MRRSRSADGAQRGGSAVAGHGVSQSCKVFAVASPYALRSKHKTHEMLDSPRAGVKKMHPCGLRLLRRDVDTDTPTRQTSLRRADRPGHVNGHASRTGAHRRCDAGVCRVRERRAMPQAACGERDGTLPRRDCAGSTKDRGGSRARAGATSDGSVWLARPIRVPSCVGGGPAHVCSRPHPASRLSSSCTRSVPPPGSSNLTRQWRPHTLLTRSSHAPHTALTRQWQPRRSSRPADIRCARGGLDAS